jgi:single-strand DNA-binding protein
MASSSTESLNVQRARNEVSLMGRLAADPVATELPSGDVVVSWRVIVDRDVRARRPPSVDTIDCCAWSARARRSVSSWHPGDIVEIEGALRRRFWQGGTGPASRYEVEVLKARRVSRAA